MMTASEALEVHLRELQARFSRIGGSGWQDKAACKGLPLGLFYPEDAADYKDSKWVIDERCKQCPVINECLQTGILEGIPPYGIHGGFTANRLHRLMQYKDKIMHPRTPKPAELANILEMRLDLTRLEASLARMEANQAIKALAGRQRKIDITSRRVMKLKKDLMRAMESALGIADVVVTNTDLNRE